MTLKLARYDSYLKRHKELEYWTEDALGYGLSLISKGDIFVAVSPRNYGKTYAATDLVREIVEGGGSVAWGRYNKPELGAAIADITEKITELEPIKVEGSQLKWYQHPSGGRVCFFSWSISQNAKGTDWPFSLIVCDEFIPERYTNKSRLDTEFADWTSVYKSLARSYNPTVIMLANCIQWINPFFVAWGILPVDKGCIDRYTQIFDVTVDGERYSTRRVVAVENCPGTPPIIRRNLKQQAVSFSSERDMERYFENETKKEYTAIGPCPDPSAPLMTLQIMSMGYYMRPRAYEGRLYWSHVKHDRTVRCYTSEGQYVDYDANTFRHKATSEAIEQLFNDGRCVFDSPETLGSFMRYLRNNRGLALIQ